MPSGGFHLWPRCVAVRREVGTWRALPIYLFLGGLLMALALFNDPDWKTALALVGGLGIAFAALAGVARTLMWVTRNVVGLRWPYLLRQGLSNLPVRAIRLYSSSFH